MSARSVKLWHRRYGEEAEGINPLLLLHGLLGSGENWHSVATNLSNSRTIIVPDLRNHGRSPHSREHDYASMAGDVVMLLDSLGIEDCTIVGHSMGGKVALRFALDHPGRVRGMVIEDMVPGSTFPRYLKFIEALRDIDLDLVSSRRDADEALAKGISDEAIRQFLLKNLERRGDGYGWRPNLAVLAESYNSLWQGLEKKGAYSGPTLFIRGGESDTVADTRIESIEEYFPQARVETIYGAGHWVHATHQSEFTSALESFLAEIDVNIDRP